MRVKVCSLPMPSRPLRASCWVSVLAPCRASPERRLTHAARSDAAQVDAVVAVEVAVLDRLQAGDQQLGHFLDPHQPALFLLLAVQRGDARRIQARGLQRLLARGVAHAGDAAAGQHDLDPARRDLRRRHR